MKHHDSPACPFPYPRQPRAPVQPNQAPAPNRHKCQPASSLPGALHQLSPYHPTQSDVRDRGVTALGDLAGEVRRVLPALRAALGEAALHDRDDGVRSEAVHALLRAGPQTATELAPLVDALDSEVDVVRFHAAIALGEFGPGARPAVPALM